MSIQQTSTSLDLRNQVIVLWTLIYHHNADCVYQFFDWQQVLCGIEGSIKTYADDDDPKIDVLIESLMDNLKHADKLPLATIDLDMSTGKKFSITIHRWEIDESTLLFRVLNKCYDQVDSNTKIDIMALLSNPK